MSSSGGSLDISEVDVSKPGSSRVGTDTTWSSGGLHYYSTPAQSKGARRLSYLTPVRGYIVPSSIYRYLQPPQKTQLQNVRAVTSRTHDSQLSPECFPISSHSRLSVLTRMFPHLLALTTLSSHQNVSPSPRTHDSQFSPECFPISSHSRLSVLTRMFPHLLALTTLSSHQNVSPSSSTHDSQFSPECFPILSHSRLSVLTRMFPHPLALTTLSYHQNVSPSSCTHDSQFSPECFPIFPLPPDNPRITEHPTDHYVSEGNPTKLTCSAEGDPEPVVAWYRNGQKVDTGQGIMKHRLAIKSNDRYELFFLRIIHEKNNTPDVGNYYCNATNIHGSAISHTASIKLAGEHFLTSPAS
ncbi:hypothetical protein RRG08_008484 [Elysia crispata]|uniref:Ig-like domain-containing protein n=1 Tax=Elysia crispata TaxID=231223 RepID=A0AAE0Z892_9GAST|nr:hypothetical protein RRG08_008484 [Elysia crispata]